MDFNIHSALRSNTGHLKNEFRPLFFRLSNTADKSALSALFASGEVVFIYDEFGEQLKELAKAMHPSRKLSPDEYRQYETAYLQGRSSDEYGVWVYYPWKKSLVHLLDEEEFIQIRTNRNQYKISGTEQELLRNKKIAIIGLSVGHAIALTLATERTCGELRLADFDSLELSNLNRIRTGVINLGLSKVIIAAREIAEIDPFINVVIYPEGINADNLDLFLTKGGKVDLLVEVCDGLDIKIDSRFRARHWGIPVIMDTNDRGMLDVERFDTDPERPILHGLAEGLNPENIRSLSNEDKVPYILKIVGIESISTRLKTSMMEVEQSINTWPQLASSVVLGGALTTDVCRRILLNQFHDSGRYYIDFDELVSDQQTVIPKTAVAVHNPHVPLTEAQRLQYVDMYLGQMPVRQERIPEQDIRKIIAAGLAAPSAGNNQPWHLVLKKGLLFLFHEAHRSWSWADSKHMGAQIALGTLIENIYLQGISLNLHSEVSLFPLKQAPELAAVIRFEKMAGEPEPMLSFLSGHIYNRYTNRKLGNRVPIAHETLDKLKKIAEAFNGVQFHFTDKENDLEQLGDIIAECDKIRLLNEQGHKEFYNEIRWSQEQAEVQRDGIELRAVDLSPSEIVGFGVGKDWNAISLLSKWNLGNGFKKMSVKSIRSASAMIALTLPASDLSAAEFIHFGQALQRMWILACAEGISIHPMMSPIFFFEKLKEKNHDLTDQHIELLQRLQSAFHKIFHIDGQKQVPVFLLKCAIAENIGVPSLRLREEETFTNYDF